MNRRIVAAVTPATRHASRMPLVGIAAMQIVGLLICVVPARAGQCNDPIPPAAIDGSTATKQQMEDAVQDFKNYQVASDKYQDCLSAQLKAEKNAAAKGTNPRPIDPAMLTAVNSEIGANQRVKEQVGSQLNAQIRIYKSLHPGG